MIEVSLVVVLGLIPFLFSLFSMRKLEREAEERLQSAIAIAHRRQLRRLLHHHPVEVVMAIGDTTCRNNALSSHLRCAINPLGPCETCRFYETL
ncbi:MAG: DUF6464 family protein [Synechococcales bacterium]|nr:DUF6464 family protein [Synechococcales bacterium]